jgi:hypothetical protein
MRLKTKWNGPTPDDVTAAIKKIHSRKKPYLSMPSLMVTDSGKEFVSDVFQIFLKRIRLRGRKQLGPDIDR